MRARGKENSRNKIERRRSRNRPYEASRTMGFIPGVMGFSLVGDKVNKGERRPFKKLLQEFKQEGTVGWNKVIGTESMKRSQIWNIF